MDSNKKLSYYEVLREVSTWPTEQRLSLIHALINNIARNHEETPIERMPTLHLALGLLATENPPPTDAEVEQWLDEHRMEKYG